MNRRSGFRVIIVANQRWQYKIGNSYVVLFSPNKEKYIANHSEILGISWNDIERFHWKNSGVDHRANIRPSTIFKWIMDNYIK